VRALVAAGAIVLAAGAARYVVGGSRADEAEADLAEAEAHDEDQEVVVRDLRNADILVANRLRQAGYDTRALRTLTVPESLRLSAARRITLEQLLATYEVSLAAMRANDFAGYNASVDRQIGLNDAVDDHGPALDDALTELVDLVEHIGSDYDSAASAARDEQHQPD
jgi:hypothetical protein